MTVAVPSASSEALQPGMRGDHASVLAIAGQAFRSAASRKELGVAGRGVGRIGERARDLGGENWAWRPFTTVYLPETMSVHGLFVLDDVLHQLDRLALHGQLEAIAHAGARFVLLMTSTALGRSVALRPMLLPEHRHAARQEHRFRRLRPGSGRMPARHVAADRFTSTGAPPFITDVASAEVGVATANKNRRLRQPCSGRR